MYETTDHLWYNVDIIFREVTTMPFIHSKVNLTVSKEQETKINEGLIDAASSCLGKPETWVMLQIEDGCRLYFRKDGETPAAYVEVALFGGENKSAFNAFTGKATEVLSSVLGIPTDRIYVKYSPTGSWGYDGGNF